MPDSEFILTPWDKLSPEALLTILLNQATEVGGEYIDPNEYKTSSFYTDKDGNIAKGTDVDNWLTSKNTTETPLLNLIDKLGWGNDNPIWGSRRVKNFLRAYDRNPYFMNNWKVAENAMEGINTMSGGLLNRLSPTLNIRLAYDWYKGKPIFTNKNGLLGSWWGNNGIEFTQNYPILNTIINGAIDVGIGLGANYTYNQGANRIKDLWWLGKTYNNVGTGLKNKYVRKYFLDLAKNPSLARNFIETYSRTNESGLTFDLIKEALPLLLLLQKEFKIIPKSQFNSYTPVTEQINEIRSGLLDAKNLVNDYTNELNLLKSKNNILYNIAKESPLYLKLIVNDFKVGNITNLEEYVKNLIKQSNTFVRRMNLKNDTDPVEAFSKISGHTMGSKDFAMDVGNPEVVYHPIWSRGYGSKAVLYTPKDVNPQGPIETWWSLRRPKFKDSSISIDDNGMHTNREGAFNNLSSNSLYNANRYLELYNLPQSYGRTNAHMIFTSPNKGASISDQFVITPYLKIPQLRYTLGYKQGGKLKYAT